MLESILHVLQHAFLDTLKALPFLYLVYLLVSYFEHNSHKHLKFFRSAKKFGPVVGGLVGTIPQCGFSVAMADLYSKKGITLGTLIAVFIATSDEAIPIMLSNYDFILPLLGMIAIKLVYAIICGYIIDLVLALFRKKRENKMEQLIHEHDEKEEHKHSCCADNIFLDALNHAWKIALFMLIVNLIFTAVVEFSEFNISSLSTINIYLQPVITSLIGLIPNCVASVFLVELFMAGGISFGALLAGLATGAGLGILMLFKRNKKEWLKNLLILLLVYALGVILGLIINILGLFA